MADDKKTSKEASNIFHSIIKAGVSTPANDNSVVGKCPRCGVVGIRIGDQQDGRILTIKFQCRNGHGEYFDTVKLA